MLLSTSQVILILSSLAAVLMLLLGIVAYFNDRKNLGNKIFFALATSVAIWIIAVIIRFYSADQYTIIISARFTFAAATVVGFLLAYFSYYFPTKNQNYKFPSIVVIVITVILAVTCSFTPYVVKNIELINGTQVDTYGFAYYVFGLYFMSAFGVSLYNLLSKYKILKLLELYQVRYYLIGFSISAILAFSTNVIIPAITGVTALARYSPFALTFFIVFATYAITKHRLFNIRVIATELLVGIVAIILFIDIITSQTIGLITLKIFILLAFLYVGYELIKSTHREIEKREEIERIDRAKSEFISIASHQLRTPLTAIKGYISMILEGIYGKLSEKQIKPLENVYYSNERLIKLVNDLLNLSRLDAGKIEFSPEPTSLEEMVSGIVEELKINAERKGLYMKMAKPEMSLPKIMVDQDKLRQVVLNIVDNAIKYTKEGGITIELKKLDDEERIRISDTGEGMTKHEIDSLFQMFSRATAGTQLHAEGAGLGLYVAKQFIKMHGGEIWVESPGKGKGSTFIIKLPVHLDPKLLKAKTKTITKQPDNFF